MPLSVFSMTSAGCPASEIVDARAFLRAFRRLRAPEGRNPGRTQPYLSVLQAFPGSDARFQPLRSPHPSRKASAADRGPREVRVGGRISGAERAGIEETGFHRGVYLVS